jgi:hypothetical protein
MTEIATYIALMAANIGVQLQSPMLRPTAYIAPIYVDAPVHTVTTYSR